MKDLLLLIFLVLELAQDYARQHDQAPEIDVKSVLGLRFEYFLDQSQDGSRVLSKQVQILQSGRDSIREPNN